VDIDAKSQDELGALYSAIGFMTVQWAQLEQALDACIAVIFHEYNGRPLMKGHGVPISLSTKLKFLKDAFKRLATLAPFRVKGKSLLDGIRDAKELRHSMIHSALNSLRHTNGIYTFTKLDYDGDFHVMKPFELDLKRFPDHTKTFSDLAEKAVVLAEALLAHLPKPPKAR
jgi:hypothetical protein